MKISLSELGQFAERVSSDEQADKTQALLALARAIQSGQVESKAIAPEVLISTLEDRLKRLLTECTFRQGDIVRWKTGMKNRKLPPEDGFGIVVEVLANPVFDSATDSSGSPYFREPLDLLLGVLDTDGEFELFHFDSRRFELAQPPATLAAQSPTT